MADPQAENGHTDIANEIVEALARIRLSGEEMQCLWVIIRKTYGWHKKEDKISLSQFANMTGIKRQSVLRALNKLSSKKIITIIKNDDRGINKYRFIKDFDKWIPLSKKITVSSKKITPVINIDNQVSSLLSHTKENVYKRKSTKEKTLSDFPTKTFINLYFESFKTKFGISPIIDGGKDGTTIKRLLSKISFEDLSELLSKFFDSNDPFIQKSGYTIGVFKSQINKLRVKNQEGFINQPGAKAFIQQALEEEKFEKRGQENIRLING